MSKLTIFINEEAVHEHDKSATLNSDQLGFLDRMDQDMARGLKMNGELVDTPTPHQRATFVAMNMIKALVQEDEAKIQVSCAYLSNRLPELSEVHARNNEGKVAIELVEGEAEA